MERKKVTLAVSVLEEKNFRGKSQSNGLYPLDASRVPSLTSSVALRRLSSRSFSSMTPFSPAKPAIFLAGTGSRGTDAGERVFSSGVEMIRVVDPTPLIR